MVAYVVAWALDIRLDIGAMVGTLAAENGDVENTSAEDFGQYASRRTPGTVVEDSAVGSIGDLNRSDDSPYCLDTRGVDPSWRAKRSKVRIGVGQPLNKAAEPLVEHWGKGKGHMPDAAVCRRSTGCRPIRDHLE